MTKNYSNLFFGLFFILVSFFIYSLKYSICEEYLRKLMLKVLYPFQISFYYINSIPTKLYSYFTQIINLEEENQKLKEQLKKLLKEREKYNLVIRENIKLKNLLKIREEYKNEVVIANVISHSGNFDYLSLIIDKGEKDGIKEGMPVVDYYKNAKVLVGKIICVSKYSSIVLLITHPECAIGGAIESKNIYGIVKGLGNKYCKFDYISQEENVSIGDEVVSVGESIIFPKNILIGKVIEVKNELPYEFLEIKIKPYLNFLKLSHVFVLKITKNEISK